MKNFVIALLMLVFLTACGSKQESTENTSTDSATTTEGTTTVVADSVEVSTSTVK